MTDGKKGRPSGLPFFLGVGLLIVGVCIVYLPGVDGPFLFDDYPNILQDRFVAIDTITIDNIVELTFPEGQFRRRPLARATFALNYYWSGQRFDALVFKLTNVLIHLINAVLVYWLCSLLCRRHASVDDAPSDDARVTPLRWVPLLAGLVWALHPIQLTSVLYVVQRMTSLSALFVFAGIILFMLGRARLERGSPFAMTLVTIGVVGGTVFGMLCKETAILTPAFALLIEWFFFDRRRLSSVFRKQLIGFYLVTVAVPGVLCMGVLLVKPEISAAMNYAIRDFGVIERVLTESRILFFYIGLLLFPNIRNFGLFHDDIPLSTGLFEPWTTSVCTAVWFIVALAVLLKARRGSMWGFALSWFLVGHVVESTFLDLEPVHEHRNYLPSLGLVLATVYYLVGFLSGRAGTRRLSIPIAGLLVLVVGFSTFTRAALWRDTLSLATGMERNHPQSYRTRMAVGLARAQAGHGLSSIYHAFRGAAAINPQAVAPLMQMVKLTHVPLITATFSAAPFGDRDINLLEDDFSNTRGWLTRVQVLLDGEITKRLRWYPIVPTTTLTLLDLVVCTTAQIAACIAVAPSSLEWHRVALENPRIREHDRRILRRSVELLREWLDTTPVD